MLCFYCSGKGQVRQIHRCRNIVMLDFCVIVSLSKCLVGAFKLNDFKEAVSCDGAVTQAYCYEVKEDCDDIC
jgi:hypothetical protein